MNVDHAHALSSAGWVRLTSGLVPAALRLPDLDDRAVSAGSRACLQLQACAALVAPIRARLAAIGLLSMDAVAVQCSLFRKTSVCNWNVACHQDLSVPVAERSTDPALTGWSIKEDGLQVQPPVELLERLLAVRLHLDDCPEQTGALRVVSGSHRQGRIATDRIAKVREAGCDTVIEAQAGDLLAMRPLLLHASSKATRPNGRRILHFLFAPPDPGYGLRWSTAL